MTATTHAPTQRLSDLINLLTVDGLDGILRPLTAEENEAVDAYLERFQGDPVTVLGADVPADVAAVMRRVMQVTR